MRPTRRRIAAPRAGKGGARASHRALAWWANDQDPRGGKPRRQADRVHLSGGNTADLRGGEALIEVITAGALVIADRAFDADRFRRVATRYDRLAAAYLGAVRDRRSPAGHIAAIVPFWL
jgi:hypothetical protein